MRPSGWVLAATAGGAVGLAACGNEVTVLSGSSGGEDCTPGITQPCYGPGQCPGIQICAADGTAWSTCYCGSGASGNTGAYGASGNTGGWGATGNSGGSGAYGNAGGSGATGNWGGYGAYGNAGGWGASGNAGGSGGAACVPSCAGASCGDDDGCGHVCTDCPPGEICEDHGQSFVCGPGNVLSIVSDASWRASPEESPGWQLVGFDDSSWEQAQSPGAEVCDSWFSPELLGRPLKPWEHDGVLSMWSIEQQQYVYLRKRFVLPSFAQVTDAMLTTVSDDDHIVYVNGALVVVEHQEGWGPPIETDLRPYLVSGVNVIAILGDDAIGGCRWILANGTIAWDVAP